MVYLDLVQAEEAEEAEPGRQEGEDGGWRVRLEGEAGGWRLEGEAEG